MSNRLMHSWDVFESQKSIFDNSRSDEIFTGMSSSRPSSNYLSTSGYYTKADLINSIISSIALDASMVELKHLKINKNDGSQSPVNSGLINCLTVEANIDQTGREFIYDAIWSMLDEGAVALVPVETSTDPNVPGSFDVTNIRVGKILQYYPKHVKVQCLNDNTGLRQDLILRKDKVGIIESPLYSVLRSSNSTLRMLNNKIDLMNSQDNNAATGKINGFIQLPYSTRMEIRKSQALSRKEEIETEMANNRFGLVTLDAKEKWIPAGTSIQNNLLDDINKLKQDFYNQIGITENILNGTAGETELNRYYRKVVDPCLQALVDEINRTFLTKTARSQGQQVMYYRDPFKTLPVEQIATTADLFTRNAILTPNEVREFIGRAPHPDPLANQLYNRNIADSNQNGGTDSIGQQSPEATDEQGDQQEPAEEIYEDGQGGYVDAEGYPVDEYGYRL